MIIPSNARGKFYVLRGLAIALLALAGATFALWPDTFEWRSFGLLGIFVALWLVKRSNAVVQTARGQVVPEWSFAAAAKRVGPLAWVLTGASLSACLAFFFTLIADLPHGGKSVWPLYALTSAVLALAATSGYVAAKLFW